MNNPVTYLGLIHVGLMIAFVLSLLGVVGFWFWAFAQGMSDAPTESPPVASLIFFHAFPVALFAAWWFT